MFNGLDREPQPRHGALGQGEGIPTPFGGRQGDDSSGIATPNRVAYAGLRSPEQRAEL
jgi:hypothetical protein